MKNKFCFFAAALLTSTFAHATPPTKDYECKDNSGNRIAWDVQNYSLGGAVQQIHSVLYATMDGVKYELPTDTALATPYQPLLLLQGEGEDPHYVIVKPVGPIKFHEGEIMGSADVELMLKGPKGSFKKKMRMKCHAFNDV